jgi:uncharacterized protein (DUF952 family)
MTPAEEWEPQSTASLYRPKGYSQEGFIHCTDSERELLSVGNRYYATDPRPYVALRISCDDVSAKVVYEDRNLLYPHIYGPLERSAVVRVVALTRDSDGRFAALGSV